MTLQRMVMMPGSCLNPSPKLMDKTKWKTTNPETCWKTTSRYTWLLLKLEISVDSCCDCPMSPASPVALQLIPPASGAPGAEIRGFSGGTVDFEWFDQCLLTNQIRGWHHSSWNEGIVGLHPLLIEVGEQFVKIHDMQGYSLNFTASQVNNPSHKHAIPNSRLPYFFQVWRPQTLTSRAQ